MATFGSSFARFSPAEAVNSISIGTGPIDPDFTRLDATQLAAYLGVSTWVVKGMKIASKEAGDSPFAGRYTTLRRATDWFDKHPEFIASHHLRK